MMNITDWLKTKYISLRDRIYASKDQIIDASTSTFRTFLAGINNIISTVFVSYVNDLVLSGTRGRPVIIGVAALIGATLGKQSFLHRLVGNAFIKKISEIGGFIYSTANTIFSLSIGFLNTMTMFMRKAEADSAQEGINNNLMEISWGIMPAAFVLAAWIALKKYSMEANELKRPFITNPHLKAMANASIQTGRTMGICLYFTHLEYKSSPAYTAAYTLAGPVTFLACYVAYLVAQNVKPTEHVINSLLTGFYMVTVAFSCYVANQVGMGASRQTSGITDEQIITISLCSAFYALLYGTFIWPEVKEEIHQDLQNATTVAIQRALPDLENNSLQNESASLLSENAQGSETGTSAAQQLARIRERENLFMIPPSAPRSIFSFT